MTADFGFVVNAAQAYADVFTVERSRDALPEACLPGSGRACEDQDRALTALFELHDREMFDNALLDVRDTVVIGIEDFSCFRDVDVLDFRFPRQFQQQVQVIDHYVVFAALGIGLFQLRRFADPDLLDIVRHVGFPDAFEIALFFAFFVKFVQLALDVFHLFAKHRFFILLFPFLPVFLRNFKLQMNGILLFDHRVHESESAFALRIHVEQRLFFFEGSAHHRNRVADEFVQ